MRDVVGWVYGNGDIYSKSVGATASIYSTYLTMWPLSIKLYRIYRILRGKKENRSLKGCEKYILCEQPPEHCGRALILCYWKFYYS